MPIVVSSVPVRYPSERMIYAKVCVAGTFDRLHAGHEALLSTAFTRGTHVLIGLTSDLYVRRWKKHEKQAVPIAPYAIRKTRLTIWLKAHGFVHKYAIVPIDDPFEPAVSDATLQAIAVSSQSRSRADELNAKRTEKHLEPLTIIEIPMVAAQDLSPISSTRVRLGDIDVNGQLILPDSLRKELSVPLGEVIADDDIVDHVRRIQKGQNSEEIVTIGDHTTKTLVDADVLPRVAVFDQMIRRKPVHDMPQLLRSRGYRIVSVKSGPGYISSEAIHALSAACRETNRVALMVEGEEDLLTLPAVILSGDGAHVYYGQPPVGKSRIQGVVHIVVGVQVRATCSELIRGFVQ